MNNPIIILTGPTASGKTAMSIDLAKKYNGEIICADSMTVYRGMDIGTDKPDQEILSAVPHHLLDIVEPDEEFNAAIFVQKVREIVDEIHSRDKLPILVGGSVMYIDAFVYDYQMPEVKPNQKLRDELNGKDNEELFKQLCKCDPDCEWTVDRHNKRRIIRAIEVCTETGKPLASQKSKKPLPENVLYLAVDRDREELYTQIDDRVDNMFSRGFVDEVRKLHVRYDHNTAMQAAGYRQVIQFLDGKIDLGAAITKTKQVHRNYAKRQLTWLRHNEDIHWVQNENEAEELIGKFL